jgi:hypothetical protein
VKNFLLNSVQLYTHAPDCGGSAGYNFAHRVLPALRTIVLLTLASGASFTYSQTKTNPAKVATTASLPAKPTKVASIKSFRIVQEQDGSAVEILSTEPLVPSIQQINDPPRLVIDLPNARLDTSYKRINIQSDQIDILRADQFQQNPPIARVVVDLLSPRSFTWDAAGNRLVVHLGKSPGDAAHSPFQVPTVASLSATPQPVVNAVRASGPLAVSSDAGSVGSSFTSGADTSVLTLSSGGQLRVCPGTTVSLTPSQDRHNLMVSMNTGAVEAHLDLDASSDLLMTPDFRIQLMGPGEFHYAFSADNQGNTCVRALPGNTASALVTELLGDRTYQVKSTDQLVFRGGHLDKVDMAVPLECGCPPPRQVTNRAAVDLPAQAPVPGASPLPDRASSSDMPRVEPSPASGIPAGIDAPPVAEVAPPNELHVQVSAPLVFHATGPPPSPMQDVRALPLDARRVDAPPASVIPPPEQLAGQKRRPSGTAIATNHPHGFFHKLGSFFAAMFR